MKFDRKATNCYDLAMSRRSPNDDRREILTVLMVFGAAAGWLALFLWQVWPRIFEVLYEAFFKH